MEQDVQQQQQHTQTQEQQYQEQQSIQQHQHKRPPMHRGYSDLGNRIKKRVTLRYVVFLIFDIIIALM